MKNLKSFIFEKILINKNIKIANSIDLSGKELSWKTTTLFNIFTPTEFKTCYKKFKKYKDENKNIKSLSSRNIQPYNLGVRLYCAVVLQWDEMIKLIHDIMIERCNLKDDHQLELFFINRLNANDNILEFFIEQHDLNMTVDELRDCFRHYLNLYNIKY